MSRFRSQSVETSTKLLTKHRRTGGQRGRLWMLLIMLGLVVATMRQLGKPETVQRLGQIFGSTEEVTEARQPVRQFVLEGDGVFDSSGPETKIVDAAKPFDPTANAPADGESADLLAAVKDNTYFRPAEGKAWFSLFARLQRMNPSQMREATLGELSYAQLVKQPEEYRGKVVTLRGTVRLEEKINAPQNSLGIKTYHRLWVSPRGGGNSLFVIYCLDLPAGFPRGKNLNAQISASGFSFKNWSYASTSGLAIAPVVLVQGVDWQAPVARPVRQTVAQQGLAKTVAIAGVIAALAVWMVVRNTRRPPRSTRPAEAVTFPEESTVETVQQQLQRLADAESRE